jgi:hypothetical protein
MDFLDDNKYFFVKEENTVSTKYYFYMPEKPSYHISMTIPKKKNEEFEWLFILHKPLEKDEVPDWFRDLIDEVEVHLLQKSNVTKKSG